MEDQINAAEKSTSISAEICQWSGAIFGILFGIGFFLTEVQKKRFKIFTLVEANLCTYRWSSSFGSW